MAPIEVSWMANNTCICHRTDNHISGLKIILYVTG